MKKIIFTYLFAGCFILSCRSQKGHSSVSYSSDGNGGKGQHSISINDDNGYLEVKYTGDIIFNEEETAIKSISPNGYIRYKRNGKKIEATAGENGRIEYEVNGGDKKTDLNNDEALLLTSAIKMLIRYGIGAGERVERIYKKGGSTAVLNEVRNMKSDFVKAIYLDYLLETNSLTADEMTGIANQTKTLIGSDFEKGKLLSKFSSKYLANETTAQAYLGAVKSISSDFEKANAVKIILKEWLSPAQFTEVLQLTKFISSDFEKSNVLKEVLQNNKISADQFSEVLQTTATINSDFEKANVLKSILNNNKLPEAQFNETLNIITNISGDFEKGNILKQVAEGEITNEAQWITLISSTAKLSSDFEKGNVLATIASKMPATENLKAAYLKSAKTLSSDFEYGKAIRAMK